MLIRSCQAATLQRVTRPGAKDAAMRLLIGRADGAPNFAMRLFEVQPSGHTPLHQHPYEHEILILQGQGQAVTGDGMTIRPIQAGDAILVPPNEKHQFRNSGDSVLSFICLVPLSYDCGQEGACTPTPGS